MKMQEFNNHESMFSQSIGITDPWRIGRTEFNEEKREVHVTVTFRKTAKYPCPECGELCDRYDDEEKERTWRHGDVVFFPCYVHCRRPRIKCKQHGVRVVTAPWARPNSRYTLDYCQYSGQIKVLLVQIFWRNTASFSLGVSILLAECGLLEL